MIDFAGSYRRLLGGALAALGLAVVIAVLRGAVISTTFSGTTGLELYSPAPVNGLWELTEELLGRPLTLEQYTEEDGIHYLLTAKGAPVDADELLLLDAALQEHYLGEVEVLRLDATAPAIARDLTVRSAAAAALAALLLFFSLGIRYQGSCGWSGAFAALAAQCYDAAWVLLTFLLFGMPIGPTAVAVLLAALGCSLGNTLLVYDRIGEELRLHGDKLTTAELVNRSVNQCFSRAITSTFTVGLVLLGVLLTAYLHRLDALVPLAFPLLVGMVAGLYSSLCLAPGLWCSLQHRPKLQK